MTREEYIEKMKYHFDQYRKNVWKGRNHADFVRYAEQMIACELDGYPEETATEATEIVEENEIVSTEEVADEHVEEVAATTECVETEFVATENIVAEDVKETSQGVFARFFGIKKD